MKKQALLLLMVLTCALTLNADDEKKDEIRFKPYGYIKLDMTYDDSRVFPGDFGLWVQPEAVNADDNQFNMTANESRLGFWVTAPERHGVVVKGRVEVDFYGGGAENKANPMMRLAYAEVYWPEHDLTLVAGQAWDILYRCHLPSFNYSVNTSIGLLAYRRPQLSLSKGIKLSDDVKLTLRAGAARTIEVPGEFGPGDIGEDFPLPSFQYSAFVTLANKSSFGVSGHFAKSELDINAEGDNVEFDSWAVKGDATVVLNETLKFQGEIWRGQNLFPYFGGVTQGVNLTTQEEIRSTGYWGGIIASPAQQWNFVGGYTCDDPEDDDLNPGMRGKNSYLFVNALYTLVEGVQFGLELGHWETEYVGQVTADANTVHGVVYYRF